MKRRLMIAALGCWSTAHRLAQAEPARPRHKISAGELHAALSARFPIELSFANLLELKVSAPRLHLLPARNKIGAALLVQLGGAQLAQTRSGEVDVLFALRYEPADQTVRADDLEILAIRWPGLPPETSQALQALLPVIAREAMVDVVLHKFSPRDLALADAMGLQPETMTVVDDGLMIYLGPKPLR